MDEVSKSSAEPAMAAWLRFAMPSVADLIFIALLGTLVFTPLSVRLLGDAGIGWHVRTGQQILSTHTIPHVDWFSSTMRGKPWFAWEWLYDVVAGALETHLGLNGVVWMTAMVIAAVFGWAFRLLILRGTNLLVALILYLLAVSASTIHFLARPHVFSWLFTLAWFSILDSSERESCSGREDGRKAAKKLWLLPLLMLVWVNVHGGFLVGFVLLAIFGLAALWEWWRASPNLIEESLERILAGRRARALFLVGLLSVVASLLNPYGWKLYAHLYPYLSNRFLMDHIDEFRSADFHELAPRCFLILLLVAVATVGMRRGELRMSAILTLLFAVYMGVYSARNIPVSSLLLIMIVGPLLGDRSSPGAMRVQNSFSFSMRLRRMAEIEGGLRTHLWPVVAILLTFAIAANGGHLGSSLLMDAHFDPKRMPVAAANYLYEHGMNPLADYSGPTCDGPVLAPDYWGGYLIYRLNWPVVVDDRHDLYGSDFFKSYLKFVRGEPGWREFLNQHEAACLIVPKDAPLNSVLTKDGWRVIYADDVAVVLIRSATPKSAS